MTDAARRGLERAEEIAERLARNGALGQGTTEQRAKVAAAIRARDQAVLEQVAKIVESDSWLVAGRAIRAFARELAEEKA